MLHFIVYSIFDASVLVDALNNTYCLFSLEKTADYCVVLIV